jgi:DNA-binding Lrp family transcriptional regulator
MGDIVEKGVTNRRPRRPPMPNTDPFAPDPIDAAVADLLRTAGSLSTAELAARLGISRQAAHRHVRRRVDDGRLVARGQTRRRRYLAGAPAAGVDRAVDAAADTSIDDWRADVHPGPMLLAERAPSYDGDVLLRRELDGLREDELWLELVAATPALADPLAAEAEPILAYVVTELVNNAIDHSGGSVVEVGLVQRTTATVTAMGTGAGSRFRGLVRDDGEGAFEVARRAHGLADHLRALEELSKGKLTSMPDRHSGEGLFFTSKALCHFELEANGLVWIVDNLRGDQTLTEVPASPGTTLRFDLAASPARSLPELFEAYTTDLSFDRTRCVLRLFEHGVRFISRSEAKRVAERLDQFRVVVVDFHGIEMVGQGFVDELFRVWAARHPEVQLLPVNMAAPVAFMVRRGLGGRGPGRRGHER